MQKLNDFMKIAITSFFSFLREEFCEIFRAKDKTTMKMFTCKKFLKKDGRKVRKAAKNEILILKMWVFAVLDYVNQKNIKQKGCFCCSFPTTCHLLKKGKKKTIFKETTISYFYQLEIEILLI